MKTNSLSVMYVTRTSLSSKKVVSPNAPRDITNPWKDTANSALSPVTTAMTKETANNVLLDSTSPKEPKHVLLATSLSFL
jgi:hypothetical protein